MPSPLASVILPGRDGAATVITLRDGSIADIELTQQAGDSWLALPGFANLHAHADRSFTVTSFRPRSFADALAASAKARAAFTAEDVQRRATMFFERCVAHGTTRVRTHTDVDPVVGLKSMDGVLAAKATMAGRIDVDVIAFSTSRNDLRRRRDAVARPRSDAIAMMQPDLFWAEASMPAEDPSGRRAATAPLDLAGAVRLAGRSAYRRASGAGQNAGPDGRQDGAGAQPRFPHHLQPSLRAVDACSRPKPNALIDAIAKRFGLPDRAAGNQPVPAGPRRRDATAARRHAGARVDRGRRQGPPRHRQRARLVLPVRRRRHARHRAVFRRDGQHGQRCGPASPALRDGRAALAVGDPADMVLVPAASIEDALSRRPASRIVFKGGRQVAGPS